MLDPYCRKKDFTWWVLNLGNSLYNAFKEVANLKLTEARS